MTSRWLKMKTAEARQAQAYTKVLEVIRRLDKEAELCASNAVDHEHHGGHGWRQAAGEISRCSGLLEAQLPVLRGALTEVEE